MRRLSESVRGDLRLFAFYLANSTLSWEFLGEDYDYSAIFEEPSELERVFAIWGNLLELDEGGEVVDSARAHRRAAQYIRRFIDPEFVVEPPFEEWELKLHL